jgi:hypothetical protein
MSQAVIRISASREGATAEGLAKKIVQELERARGRIVAAESNRIEFRGGIFRFAPGWNLLCMISKGWVSVDLQAGKVRYTLSFGQLWVLGIAMAALMATPAWRGGRSLGSYLPTILFFSLWLVGMNYIVARIRFRSFIMRCIHGAGFSVV